MTPRPALAATAPQAHPNRDLVRFDTRWAGQVRRYHTWPMLTEQTVAEHCYHCMRLWWHFWGPLPSHITTFFLWHDSGEIVTGDMPFPVKAENPDLKAAAERIERRSLRELLSLHAEALLPTDMLSEMEKKQVKICDLLEMFEKGFDEYMMGNRYAWPIMTDTWEHAMKLLFGMAQEYSSPVYRHLTQYSWVFEDEEGTDADN